MLDEVRQLAGSGEPAAVALEAALLRLAAAHVCEYLESDVAAAMHAYLGAHRTLPKYDGAGLGGRGQHDADRVAKCSTQGG